MKAQVDGNGKTRNKKGEEFVGNRMEPLASAVAARTADAILSGLTGAENMRRSLAQQPRYSQPNGFCAAWTHR